MLSWFVRGIYWAHVPLLPPLLNAERFRLKNRPRVVDGFWCSRSTPERAPGVATAIASHCCVRAAFTCYRYFLPNGIRNIQRPCDWFLCLLLIVHCKGTTVILAQTIYGTGNTYIANSRRFIE